MFDTTKLVRDKRSKALINTDESSLEKRKILREKMKQQDVLQSRIETLENEMIELKAMLKASGVLE